MLFGGLMISSTAFAPGGEERMVYGIARVVNHRSNDRVRGHQKKNHTTGRTLSTRVVLCTGPPSTPNGHGGYRVLMVGHGGSCERPGTPVTMLREDARVKNQC